ncbi:MAG: hypothetical protein COA71_14535 [SAR86 cluster bacterium]|uniref:Uncharacterized protein n=1 Tax=SAR86 cluster bacterium TaxID=2030880 RepID=A0A2A5C6N3_9GAMM|nr:MAG: hypothetical protein COA71_14535 [SAR86 cluster bacterium]
MAFKLLGAVTSTGVSVSKDLGKVVSHHTVQITTTGDPTAVTVDLEASLDNETFIQIGTHPFPAEDITAGNAMFHVIDKPVQFIQLNLTTLTGGTAPTVSAFYDHVV